MTKGNDAAKPKKSVIKRVLRVLAILIAVPLAIVVLVISAGFLGSIGMEQEPLPVEAATVLKRARVGEIGRAHV